ncbi:hypothetical protein BC829DRAFT_6305 [Chytridium lagenaria]|nr:hypothetical protein BC829DRAFT_6305 [Chytridium lagenaria]
MQAVRLGGHNLGDIWSCPAGDDCMQRLRSGLWYERADISVLGHRYLPVDFAVHQQIPALKEERKSTSMLISERAHPAVTATYFLKEKQKVVVNVNARDWNSCYLELNIHAEGAGYKTVNLTNVFQETNSTTYIFTHLLESESYFDFIARIQGKNKECRSSSVDIRTEGPTLKYEKATAYSKCDISVIEHDCSLKSRHNLLSTSLRVKIEDIKCTIDRGCRSGLEFSALALSVLFCLGG